MSKITQKTETARSQDSSRRGFLGNLGTGCGSIALASLLTRDGLAVDSAQATSRTDRLPFAPRAKNVIWLFMVGGTSHVESFDPKPALNQYAGQ
jgi:hypothetical protein